MMNWILYYKFCGILTLFDISSPLKTLLNYSNKFIAFLPHLDCLKTCSFPNCAISCIIENILFTKFGGILTHFPPITQCTTVTFSLIYTLIPNCTLKLKHQHQFKLNIMHWKHSVNQDWLKCDSLWYNFYHSLQNELQLQYNSVPVKLRTIPLLYHALTFCKFKHWDIFIQMNSKCCFKQLWKFSMQSDVVN